MIVVAFGVVMFIYVLLFMLGIFQIILSILGFLKLKEYKNYNKAELIVRHIIYGMSLLAWVLLVSIVSYVMIWFFSSLEL